LNSFIPPVWLESIPISLCKAATPRQAVSFFQLQQVNEDTIANLKTRTGKDISREELSKPTAKSLRDEARREQKKVSKQFEIDEPVRQPSRDEVQVVLTELVKELQQETATGPGEFPSTPKKKGKLAPPPDPDSSSHDSDSNSNANMSEVGPADPLHLLQTQYLKGQPG